MTAERIESLKSRIKIFLLRTLNVQLRLYDAIQTWQIRQQRERKKAAAINSDKHKYGKMIDKPNLIRGSLEA